MGFSKKRLTQDFTFRDADGTLYYGDAGVRRKEQVFAQRQAEEAARAEEARKNNERAAGRNYIDGAFGQFGDSYYDSLKSDYSNYYTSGVENQYTQKRNELAGGMQSTQGTGAYDYVRQIDALDQDYAAKRAQAGTAANNYVSGVRSDVDNTRNSLYAQNDQLANSGAIGQTASNSAAGIRGRQFSPLGNMFASFSPQTGVSTAPNQAGGNVAYGSYAAKSGTLNPAAFNIAPVSSSRVVS